MRTIHHVLDIASPVPPVWEALTERKGLAGWWSTKLESDGAAVGSKIRFTFAGDFNPVMEVTGVEPERSLHWMCIEGHSNWQDNTFDFELVALPDGRTRLRFTQNYATELSDDDYGVYNFNWGYYLESLRSSASKGRASPSTRATVDAR